MLALLTVQEPLPSNLLREIEEEYDGKLRDINKVLTNVETAIHYLNSVGDQSDMSLQDFMTGTLKIETRLIRRRKVKLQILFPFCSLCRRTQMKLNKFNCMFVD